MAASSPGCGVSFGSSLWQSETVGVSTRGDKSQAAPGSEELGSDRASSAGGRQAADHEPSALAKLERAIEQIAGGVPGSSRQALEPDPDDPDARRERELRADPKTRKASLLVAGLMRTPDCALEVFRDGRAADHELDLSRLHRARDLLDAVHGAITNADEELWHKLDAAWHAISSGLPMAAPPEQSGRVPPQRPAMRAAQPAMSVTTPAVEPHAAPHADEPAPSPPPAPPPRPPKETRSLPPPPIFTLPTAPARPSKPLRPGAPERPRPQPPPEERTRADVEIAGLGPALPFKKPAPAAAPSSDADERVDPNESTARMRAHVLPFRTSATPFTATPGGALQRAGAVPDEGAGVPSTTSPGAAPPRPIPSGLPFSSPSTAPASHGPASTSAPQDAPTGAARPGFVTSGPRGLLVDEPTSDLDTLDSRGTTPRAAAAHGAGPAASPVAEHDDHTVVLSNVQGSGVTEPSDDGCDDETAVAVKLTSLVGDRATAGAGAPIRPAAGVPARPAEPVQRAASPAPSPSSPGDTSRLPAVGATATSSQTDAAMEPGLNRYASYCAELSLDPARLLEIRWRYGVANDVAHAQLEAYWSTRFAQAPALRQSWELLCRRYAAWLTAQRR